MTNLPDLWAPPLSANPTHFFRGAGVTNWASVTIENDTGITLLVSNNPDSPPSTDAATAWRLVPAGANVTWPLGTAGVAYRLLGTPVAGAVVQTLLSDQAAPAGGTTGTVNVASGTLSVTGPVNVQTATGINLTTSSGLATQTTIGINLGTTTTTINLMDNVQKLMLLYSASGTPIQVGIFGATTGTSYFFSWLGDTDTMSIYVAGISSGTGTSVDSQVTVQIVSSTGGGRLDVVQSYAPPALSANDLYPVATQNATTQFNKNLHVYDSSGKSYAQATIVGANQSVVIIPIPPVDRMISLQEIVFYNDIVQVGSFLQIGGGALANAPVLTSDNAIVAGLQQRLPLHGFTLPGGTELRATTNAGATPTWRVRAVYSIVND